MTADEVIRTRVDEVQTEMTMRVRARLAELGSGISVEQIEMHEPTPPLQVRDAFDRTQRAENRKAERINDAKQERTKILTEAAGSGYQTVLDALDALDAPASTGPAHRSNARASTMRCKKAEGRAGELIEDASAYLSVVVGKMESDVEEYRTLVPEYERNAAMLVERLWEETRWQVYANPGVIKLYRPSHLREFRVVIPLDEQQQQIDDEERLQGTEFDAEKIRPKKWRIVGPGMD